MRLGRFQLSRGFRVVSRLGLLTVLALVHVQWALAIPVDPSQLEQAIAERRKLIPEFSRIAREAEARGLRVFLAGGLAASYGDFVKHQVLAEQGKEIIQPARLANITSNVVLPEQDYDLVLTRADGKAESPEELKSFKSWLETSMPKTLEGVSKWDVIGLKTTVGKHIAVEGDPDFARQNNDSLSIGLIELTDPPDGKSVIQEAHHLAKPSGRSVFLSDLAGDQITFLESPAHHQTQKAAAGNNPEILGAIRYLIKSLQFNKEIPQSQYRAIERIVSSFDPSSITPGSYPHNWIQKRAKHLMNHAYDPNEALRILNQLGLRHKLMQIGGSANEVGTLSSWLNKYPLPVKPEGQAPDGALTAEKLGIKQVAHETNDFAHRLISWRYDSLPRAFISRKDHPGETAVFGRGFYTAKGTNAGAYSNGRGLPIVFDVDPNAVEGKDFVRFGDQDGVLWLNGSRLKARQETREYSPAVCVTQHLTQVGVAPAVVGSSRRPPDRLSLAVLGGGSLFILLEKLTSKSKQTPSQPTAQSSTQAQDASANGATPAAVSPCLSALKSVGLQGSSAENFCDRDPTPAQIDLLKKIVNKVRTKQWSWSNDALAWISSITDNVSFDCVNQIIDTDFLNPSQTSVLRFCSDVKNIHQSSTLSKISADVRDKRLRWSEDTLQRLSMIQDNQSLNCVDQVVGMNYFNPTHSSVLNFCSAVENADQVEALAKVAGYVRDRNLQWSDDALNGILSVRDKLSLDCINKVIAADYLNPSQSSVLNFCTQVKNINQSDALSKIAAYVRDNRLQWNNDAFGGVLYLTDNASFDCVDRVIAAKYFNPSHNSVLNFCSNVKNFAQSDALKKIATYVRDNRLQWNNDAFGGVLYLNDNLAFECIDKVIAANYFNPAHSSVLNFCSGVENANQIAALSKIVSYVRDKNLQWSDGALTGISGLRDKLAVDCIDKVVASDYLNPSHSSVLNFCSQVNDARQSAALGKIATYVREKKLRWNNDVFSTLSWMKSPQTDCVLNEISRGGDAFVALKRCQSSGP